jgi:hypothetical protein
MAVLCNINSRFAVPLYLELQRHCFGDNRRECFPGQRRLAARIGCSLGTVNWLIGVFVELGIIEKRYRGRHCVYRFTEVRNPSISAHCSVSRTEDRREEISPVRETSTSGLVPSPAAARTRTRDGEGEAKKETGPAKPADAGSQRIEHPTGVTAPLPASRITPWARKHPAEAARKINWLTSPKNGLLHWVRVKSPADMPLIERALWSVRHGHYWRDLSLAERDRVEELDAAHKANPLIFELPEKHRERERIADARAMAGTATWNPQPRPDGPGRPFSAMAGLAEFIARREASA